MRNTFIGKIILEALIVVCSVSGASIYSLYTDHRAVKADDILTVIIVEEAKAGSQSGTQANKKRSLSVEGAHGMGALGFVPGFGAKTGFGVGYDGDAGTSRHGSLAAKVSARIVRVMDNGNLVIEGSKVVEINEEKEIIKVSGIVRPGDIEANNIVYSYNIADAEIKYSGKGTVNSGQRPGLISKFLNWIF